MMCKPFFLEQLILRLRLVTHAIANLFFLDMFF